MPRARVPDGLARRHRARSISDHHLSSDRWRNNFVPIGFGADAEQQDGLVVRAGLIQDRGLHRDRRVAELSCNPVQRIRAGIGVLPPYKASSGQAHMHIVMAQFQLA